MRHKKRKFKINGYVLFSALILIVLVFIQTFLLTQPKITSKNDDTTQTSTKNSTAKKDSPTKLEKESTHMTISSKKYAYSADKIRKYITGEEPYKGEKLVFLTFDDGVNNQITPQVLDTLKKYNVHATFFLVGNTLTSENQNIVKREVAEGHSIGFHSSTHDYATLYPNGIVNTEEIQAEIATMKNSLKKILGETFQTTLWRYPGGHMSWGGTEKSDELFKQLGIHWIDWNAMVGDAEPLDRQPTTVAEMLAFHQHSLEVYPDYNIRVVLMHDSVDKELTKQALPQLIEFYQANGYQFGVLY
ncbi:polysaccharide deacetylase family protein [Enterococcus faecalis]|uniref:polysaccharide deacetylase family protein n=1 Tax=Enterococcus TaxID=1350 RepID=UPI000CF22023|nr:polysaccharide deacetylase family protein [Enterococcus faecalis]MBW9290020.1 polysaccharide deacetylase [Enterococcus faecalis]NSU15795.1 polysaccharide deacetylase [Enterococcus faecalis]PQF13073.1 polysaccharide deacetylase [Enterococcus faecalis]RBR52841.1 polysaccharide deacetylase [Enterococcus faecalis]HBG9553113.1 polysaccharide deacetylase [Enterococcus faecalis]